MAVETWGAFLPSIQPNVLLAPGKFLFNRKQICQIITNLSKYVLKQLCQENMSLPSGLDREFLQTDLQGAFNQVRDYSEYYEATLDISCTEI